MSYNYDKFLRPITTSDRSIKILDESNNIKYTINPFSIKNVAISNNILKINLKSQRAITLHFPTINEVKLALTKIQIQIDALIKNVPLIDRDVKNYVDSIFSKDKYTATSSTSFQLPIIGDIINLETQKDLAYTSPQSVIIYNDTNLYDNNYEFGGDYFVGKIDSYDKNTGDMTMVVDFSTTIVTGETYSLWYMNLSGTPGVSTIGPTGATGSVETTDRLIYNNNLEVVLDSQGTLNTPLLLPTSFTAVCDSNHMIGTYEFIDNNWWQFEVSFQVNPDGIVETMIDNIFPILTNPGYVSGNAFGFSEQDHGIPNFIFSIQLNNVVLPGGAEWTANLTMSQPPTYPSTIKSLGAVKITANDKHLTFGTDGTLTFPDNSVQTTAAYITPYKVYTALLTQSGTASPVAIVLENTLGFTPTWEYLTIGSYGINNVLFTENKTIVNVFLNVNGAGYSFNSTVFTSNIIVNSVFLSDYTYTDGILNNTAIEIRVYN